MVNKRGQRLFSVFEEEINTALWTDAALPASLALPSHVSLERKTSLLSVKSHTCRKNHASSVFAVVEFPANPLIPLDAGGIGVSNISTRVHLCFVFISFCFCLIEHGSIRQSGWTRLCAFENSAFLLLPHTAYETVDIQ